MEAVPVKIVPRGYGETERQDAWWIEADPRRRRVLVVSRLRDCGRRCRTSTSSSDRISRPSIRRCCGATSHHAWLGPRPDWFPVALFYPALLILPVPGLFRFTCYYYRGAYYKAFWQDPVSCAVGEPRGTSYWGERWFPLVLQNVHRYFAYWRCSSSSSCRTTSGWRCGWPNPNTGETEFGIGVGHARDARQRRCSSPATHSAATRCATSSAAIATKCRRPRSAKRATGARAR